MAVAVQQSSETNRTSQPLGLIAASVVGAAFVLAAAALILRVIPTLWENGVGQALTGAVNSFFSVAVQIVVQLGAIIGLIYAGTKIGEGHRSASGIRGGIFLMISSAFTLFFCGRAVYLIAGRGLSFGSIVALMFNAALIALVIQMFRTGRFGRWSVALDEAGWFSTDTYKRTQGLRVRRLTVLGLLLILGSGVWTLMNHNWLPHNGSVKVDGADISNRFGDWVVGGTVSDRPTRLIDGFTILPDLALTVPLVLIAASLWLAWRVVNYPMFADFLIATEAEINKVSWSTRKSMIRDTIVVLTFLVLITVFLFVVDIFWGWLLGQSWIGVLPTAAEKEAIAPKQPVDDSQAKW